MAIVKAIEGFVMFSVISLGLLQIMSLRFFSGANQTPLSWLCTASKAIHSEATIADFMWKTIFYTLHKKTNLEVIRFIRDAQMPMLRIRKGHFGINPNEIRFSQSLVNVAEEITNSMKADGWNGDPIDVVRMSDGQLTAIDNTRVAVARQAGIDVQVNINGYNCQVTLLIDLQQKKGFYQLGERP